MTDASSGQEFINEDAAQKTPRREAIGKPCRSCGHLNELPFVFCEECGSPRAKLGRFRVTSYVMFVLVCFLGAFLLNGNEILREDYMPWPWPLYILYAVFFTHFTSIVSQGRFFQWSRIVIWCLLFFGGFLAFFHFLHLDTFGKDFYFSAVTELRVIAQEQPLAVLPVVAGVLLAICVPLYLRWTRLYGWVNAYRVTLLTVLIFTVLLIGTLQLLDFCYQKQLLPAIQENLGSIIAEDKPAYTRWLTLVAVRLFQFFLFEVFVFSAVKGYANTRRYKSPRDAEELKRASGLTKSALQLVVMIKRFVAAVESMARYMAATLVELVKDIITVCQATAREMVTPVIVLTLSAYLIHRNAYSTIAYIDPADPANTPFINYPAIIDLTVCVTLLLAGAMIFIACKTQMRWRRIMGFYGALISWLLPNLLVFFLLMSLTLALSSKSLEWLELDEDFSLPFRAGALTIGVGAALAILTLAIFIRRRFHQDAEQELAEQSTAAQPEPVIETPPPPETEKKKSLKERLLPFQAGEEKPNLAGAAKGTLRKLGLEASAQRLMDSAREINERLQGKPKIIDELLEVKEQLRKKEQQIEALERTREKISDEVYENLRRKYDGELADLVFHRNKLQAQLDKEYAKSLVDKAAAELRVTELDARKQEYAALLEAGAIEKAQHDKEIAAVERKLDPAHEELSAMTRLVSFYAQQASREAMQQDRQEREGHEAPESSDE
ncbi:hypothetical protein JXA32_04110 [Candidatus Sumerlaeota bacterium]|nr:hypothetical protein [Candidatus Sumerlaeota bacterium]